MLLTSGSLVYHQNLLLNGHRRGHRLILEPLLRRRKAAAVVFQATNSIRNSNRDAREEKKKTDRALAGRGAFPLSAPASKALIARSAIVVVALGFIDAGYSGDWSRIGVISGETEEVLKQAAYFVVPLCLYFIFKFSVEESSSKNK